MDEKIRARYAYWRKRGANDERRALTASQALSYARYEARMAALDIEWDWDGHDHRYATFARGTMEHNGTTFYVYVGQDDQGVEWGDCEPTEREREHAESYYVAVVVDDEDDREVFHDGIGGVDVIDLEGYLQRDWEDAARYALLEYLLPTVEHFIDTETVERAEWAARGTVTC